MKVWYTVADWTARRRELAGSRIGFVPTMGALHRGHASLVERCRAENQVAVVSIFVNPAQFNDRRDLERYPRTLETDLSLLEALGTDEVFVPAAGEIYPEGRRFRVEEDCLTRVMEGAYRPGFFNGVMTVVLKLLHLVQPERAYLGEKDYQQLRVIDAMVRDFFLATEIVACGTVRETSGLAESSRNALLSPAGRDKAASLFRSLSEAPDPAAARSLLEREGFQVDYVEEHWGRRFGAASIEGVRLIDNVPLACGGR